MWLPGGLKASAASHSFLTVHIVKLYRLSSSQAMSKQKKPTLPGCTTLHVAPNDNVPTDNVPAGAGGLAPARPRLPQPQRSPNQRNPHLRLRPDPLRLPAAQCRPVHPRNTQPPAIPQYPRQWRLVRVSRPPRVLHHRPKQTARIKMEHESVRSRRHVAS